MSAIPGVATLSVDDILGIYRRLADDFGNAEDAISPAGVKDRGLLESAVHRQFTGYGGAWKYPHPLRNAASLVYGVCCDHPFYNGNKRTALVSLLVHLDANGLVLHEVSHGDLYDALLKVADHRPLIRKMRLGSDGRIADVDAEVEGIAQWLRERTRKISRGERLITYRSLRQILARFGLEFEVVGANRGAVFRWEEGRGFLGIGRRRRARVQIHAMGYHDEGTEISKDDIRRLRQSCGLTEENGVDSVSFYDTGIIVDGFICKYRRVLRRLARV